jgi:hypothetical protein
MNKNALKYIAIFAMTLDHIGKYITFLNPILSIIFMIVGRITFPIMCFFIAEGFKYTKDKKKYALRLLTVALVSQIPWTLLHHNALFTWNLVTEFNTIFTLFMSFCMLWLIESDMKLTYKSLLIVFIVAFCFLCDYKIIGLMYTLYFYLFRDKKYKFYLLSLVYILSIALYIYISDLGYIEAVYTSLMDIGLFFTIPLFICYNNKSGSKHIFNKYFFYIYYPAHLLALFLIIGLF